MEKTKIEDNGLKSRLERLEEELFGEPKRIKCNDCRFFESDGIYTCGITLPRQYKSSQKSVYPDFSCDLGKRKIPIKPEDHIVIDPWWSY